MSAKHQNSAVSLTFSFIPVSVSASVISTSRIMESLYQNTGAEPKKQLDVLCSLCSSLFCDSLCMHPTGDYCSGRRGQYHHHIKDLRRSAADGCHLCCIFLYQIDKDQAAFPDNFPLHDFTPWIMLSTSGGYESPRPKRVRPSQHKSKSKDCIRRSRNSSHSFRSHDDADPPATTITYLGQTSDAISPNHLSTSRRDDEIELPIASNSFTEAKGPKQSEASDHTYVRGDEPSTTSYQPEATEERQDFGDVFDLDHQNHEQDGSVQESSCSDSSDDDSGDSESLSDAGQPVKNYWLLLHRERPREQLLSIGRISLEVIDDKPSSTDNRISSFNTSSSESLGLMKSWLADCLENHEDCDLLIQKNRPKVLPTRLLSLTRLNEQAVINIVDTVSLPGDTNYVTLSHCWGDRQGLKLTSSSYDEFHAAISLDLLPLTFIHAARLARELDCNYIWIDSLCIVQDSREDWLKESATMASVYSNALLNLAAGAARSSEEGIFRERNPLPLVACDIPARCSCTEGRWIRCVGSPSSIDSGPLHKRAWVIQEVILAPRVITFGLEQIGWECATKTGSEVEMSDTDQWSQKRMLAGYTDWVDQKLELEVPRDNSWRTSEAGAVRKSHLYTWQLMFQNNYCTADLTFESDKLVAIAGVARKLHESSQGKLGRYLAGLWEYSLLAQLDWDSGGETKRSAEYRAPTWSWASLEGPIRAGWGSGQREWRFICTILEVETTPVMDPFGAVVAGHLKVSGRLCCVFLHEGLSKSEKKSWCPWDFVEVQDGCYYGSEMSATEDDRDIWFQLQEDHAPLYIMPLYENRNRGFKALVLQPTNKKAGQYHRIGTINPYSSDLRDAMHRAMESQALSDQFHQGKDEFGNFIIEIV